MGDRILALVLGKGSSTRVPLKNIAIVGGRPLIHYTFDHIAAMQHYKPDTVVMTESSDVADHCGNTDVYREVIKPHEHIALRVSNATLAMESRHGVTYAYVMLLNADVPVRPPTLLDAAIREAQQTNADFIQSVIPVPPQLHPHRLVRVSACSGVMYPFSHRAGVDGLSEYYPPVYALAGGCFVIRRALLPQIGFTGLHHPSVHSRPIICKADQIVEIDTPADLENFRKRVDYASQRVS